MPHTHSTFYLTSGLLGRPTDVVFVEPGVIHDRFHCWCAEHNVCYTTLSESNAARMLLCRDGIGVGVFLADDISVDLNKHRSNEAQMLAFDLIKCMGIGTLRMPIALSPDLLVGYEPVFNSV